MQYIDIIAKKRDGCELSREEIYHLIHGVVTNELADCQLAAFLMAARINGMGDAETAVLTRAMAESGDMLELSRYGTISCDKHSTGGVGDKTTLIVAPIVAALGGKLAKMSGRALGHTGGTIDKLESIPGFRTSLSTNEFLDQVDEIGLAVCSQSASFAPADKRMYSLRDVTATVDSAPLIASSIMSKKLAAGAHNILLDVKCGSGAFLKEREQACSLARIMTDIGRRCEKNVRALMTDMDKPLGFAVGNALEVIEAVETLRGRGPDDLRRVSLTLAGMLIAMAYGITDDEGIARAESVLATGKAYEKFVEWISRQGGDARYVIAPELFGSSTVVCELRAKTDGYIASTDTSVIGAAAVVLGAGRLTKDAPIDPLAGIVFKKKTGDEVACGEVIAELHTSTPEKASDAMGMLENAIAFSKVAPEKTSPIIEII